MILTASRPRTLNEISESIINYQDRFQRTNKSTVLNLALLYLRCELSLDEYHHEITLKVPGHNWFIKTWYGGPYYLQAHDIISKQVKIIGGSSELLSIKAFTESVLRTTGLTKW